MSQIYGLVCSEHLLTYSHGTYLTLNLELSYTGIAMSSVSSNTTERVLKLVAIVDTRSTCEVVITRNHVFHLT